jgi:hypothetical protein
LCVSDCNRVVVYPFQWINRELQRLDRLIDKANEKGWPEYPCCMSYFDHALMFLNAEIYLVPTFISINVLLAHKRTLYCAVISLTGDILRSMNTWIRNSSYANHQNNNVYLKRYHELFRIWKMVKKLKFKLQQETCLLRRVLLLFKVTLLGIVSRIFYDR